jgi:hypothetical protein
MLVETAENFERIHTGEELWEPHTWAELELWGTHNATPGTWRQVKSLLDSRASIGSGTTILLIAIADRGVTTTRILRETIQAGS